MAVEFHGIRYLDHLRDWDFGKNDPSTIQVIGDTIKGLPGPDRMAPGFPKARCREKGLKSLIIASRWSCRFNEMPPRELRSQLLGRLSKTQIPLGFSPRVTVMSRDLPFRKTLSSTVSPGR